MQFRRNMMSPVFTLLLAGVVASIVGTARAEVVHENPSAKAEAMKKLAVPSRLRTTNTTVGDPDTTWIGHVVGNTGLPGVSGGYGPFHIGRGGYRPRYAGTPSPATTPAFGGDITYSVTGANNGYWDFDRFNAGETDTLQGWWPIQTPFQSVGGSNQIDRKRPFFGFDYGNEGNYAGNDTQKKTFGVISYWHRDNGTAPITAISGTNPVAPGWTPIAGSFSAWCGLRGHGDLTAVDPITGNAINCAVIAMEGDNHFQQVGPVNPAGNDSNFPGYGSQWDQMMYKDFTHTTGQPMTVSFKYRTNMSTGVQTATNIRIGWFDKDPLLTVSLNDGNFISSSDAGTNAPIDSFMVYVGVPVNDNACFYTDNPLTARKVYDTKRRWFSEVVSINLPYYELLSTYGVGNGTPSFVIPASVLDAMGGSVRVVFRVKTNRGWDDEDSYNSTFTSGGSGAAIVDDISVQDGGNAPAVTGFELAGDIDNNAAPTAAWRTTGKPPGVFFHWHNLQAGNPGGYASGLPYSDPCGPIGGPGRLCNMFGNIVTPGNHDLAGEKPAGQFGANDQDRQDWFFSPTINLCSSGNGAGFYNDMGVDQDIAWAQGEVWLAYDAYVNLLQFSAGATANGMRVGYQTYPATQPNGSKVWGTATKTISFSDYSGFLGCANGQNGISPAGDFGIGDGSYTVWTANGVPDSMRAFVEHLSICFRRPVTAATCSPSTGPYVGLYLDNLSLGLIDGASPPGIAGQIWDLWQDAFPTNSDNSYVGAPAFDTLAAQVRTGWNSGPQTQSLARNEIPGDSMYVKAPSGAGVTHRVDLVFRILPGPGNYFGTVPTGQHKVGLLKKRPDQAAQATAGDGSFWGSYMQDVGVFGGDGSVYVSSMKPMGGAGGYNTAITANSWDPNCWLSARCDTLENNLFPVDLVNSNASGIQPGQYQSTYHETEMYSDWNTSLRNGSVSPFTASSNRGAFIAPHYRCIAINTASGSPLDQTNIDCTGGSTYLTTFQNVYLPAIGGAYIDRTITTASITSGAQLGLTKEFTKIIPDGQLTAGSHVEYFFRKVLFGNFLPSAELYPDTTLIYPNIDGSYDGHRWAEMNVLPDRWKDGNYTTGSPGMACMLVVNAASRRGEMPVFDNMAATIGLMASNKLGAGTGYYIGATEDIPGNLASLSSAAEKISRNVGQKGSLYDVYNVIDGESNVPSGRLGSRYATQPSGGLLVGKQSTAGPTKLMLKNYYRHLFVLATDIGPSAWGPITDQTSDDIGIMSDYMTDATGSATPRTVIVIGKDIVKGQNTDHPTFFPTYFGATFRNDDYRGLSGNSNDAADLIPVAPLTPLNPGAIYGVFSPCTYANDVLNVNTAVSGAAGAVFYENVGAGGPYIAAVYAPAGGTRLANTLAAGWTFGTFGQQGSRYTLSRGGHHVFWLNALTGLIGSVCGQPLTAPSGVGDGFTTGSKFVNFMNLRSENPMRSGEARIAFGITKTEKVEVKVYDVTGRLVKTVANQVFAGGQEHVVRWDGTDNQGQLVSRGVYFYQLRSPSFVSEKKLTVLKD